MTAIIDGVTVIGTPEEINRLIEIRQKPNSNWEEHIKRIMQKDGVSTGTYLNSCCESH